MASPGKLLMGSDARRYGEHYENQEQVKSEFNIFVFFLCFFWVLNVVFGPDIRNDERWFVFPAR